MATVSKKQFLVGFKTKRLDDVPGIDGEVTIKELSAAERNLLAMRMADAAPGGDFDELPMAVFAQEFPFIVYVGLKVPSLTLAEVERIPASLSEAVNYLAVEILKLSDMWAEEDEEEGPSPKG